MSEDELKYRIIEVIKHMPISLSMQLLTDLEAYTQIKLLAHKKALLQRLLDVQYRATTTESINAVNDIIEAELEKLNG